jgi:thiol:disulfide interchange protein DsbD
VHTGEFSVDIPLTNIESSQVSFIAKFQGCWLGGICYPPVEKSTDITLPEVTAGNTINPVKTLPKSVPSVTSTNSEPLNETDKITALLQQDNILWVLASFFGFGLLLSLTPCVFPMIPI